MEFSLRIALAIDEYLNEYFPNLVYSFGIHMKWPLSVQVVHQRNAIIKSLVIYCLNIYQALQIVYARICETFKLYSS